MDAEDYANIIRLVRRAPLANMDEAEVVNRLLQRFAEHADMMTIDIGENPDSDSPELSAV